MRILPDFRRGVFNIPHTILNFFGLKNTMALEDYKDAQGDRLILILVDGLGMNLWKKYALHRRFPQFSILRSLFPSTTANVLTTLYTGLAPKEHGILEFRMYYEEYGGVIKTLPFTTLDSDRNDLLVEMGYSPTPLFRLPTIFEKQRREGISSASLFREDYADASYTHYLMQGSKIVPYKNLEDAFLQLRKRKENFIYLYIDYLDTTEHQYGVHSRETGELIARIFREIEKLWKESKAAIFITADHGQIDIEKKEIIPWNCENPPAGSPRDVFVYHCDVPEEGDWDIWSKEYILRSGILGEGKEQRNLRKRLPDYIILPRGNTGVWSDAFRAVGLHGGLSPQEMLVPFVLLEKS